jgi:hypothetical protein
MALDKSACVNRSQEVMDNGGIQNLPAENSHSGLPTSLEVAVRATYKAISAMLFWQKKHIS